MKSVSFFPFPSLFPIPSWNFDEGRKEGDILGGEKKESAAPNTSAGK